MAALGIKNHFINVLVLFYALSVSPFAHAADSVLFGWLKKLQVQETTEVYVAKPHQYNIPAGKDVLVWLTQLTEKLEARLQIDPVRAPVIHLKLGDAYHWIGHLLKDKQDYENALDAFQRSYVHYHSTPLDHSPMINNMLTREHAKFHLVITLKTLGLPVPESLSVFEEKRVPDFNHLETSKQLYRMELDQLVESTKNCKRVVE